MSDSVVLSSAPTTTFAARADYQRYDHILTQVAAAFLTFALLWACTDLLLYLRIVTHQVRPYTILYLIPVAIGAALLGVRGGVAAAVLTLILARAYLFTDAQHGLALIKTFPQVSEDIEFGALAVGTLTIALVTGRLRETLGLLRAANGKLTATNVRLKESEHQRQSFNRDVLLAVTGGKLKLVEPDELPPSDIRHNPPSLVMPLAETVDASALRHAIQRIAEESRLDEARRSDLITSVTEAATNAIKHGGGGTARVWAASSGVWVEVQDRGAGIAPAELARATLEAGFSTRVSLGMGFYMMLQTADALALSTGDKGTTVILQVANRPRATEQEALLARYASL